VYDIALLRQKFSLDRMLKLIVVAAPVVVDKVSIAFAYAWRGSCMSHMGSSHASAAFTCIKMMERVAFLPAIASAQVVTFLVSNDLGRGNWTDIHGNIKKILQLAIIMVGFILLIGSLWPLWFAAFFDKNNEFGYLVAIIFPALSVLILMDLVQLILSAALRGAGDVKTVMLTRVSVIGLFFIPSTYLLAYVPFEQMVHKMLATYASFLLGNVFMSMVYIYRLRQNHWKK
jgi:Na+-driven multidrug efflux pump